MTTVILRNNESDQQLIKRFRKQVSKSGKLSALREKRWFVAKGEQRRMDKKKAIRRLARKKNKTYRSRY